MRIPHFILFGLLFQLSVVSATAIPISIHWPEGTNEGYTVRGVTKIPAKQSGTYEVAEGQGKLIEGIGFKVMFAVVHGKVELPVFFAAPNWGVHFDSQTSTFSFIALDVRVVVKDFDGDVAIDSPNTAQAASGMLTAKLVPGQHTLFYAGNRLPFDLGADGFVTLDNNVSGITARHSTIYLQGIPVEIAADHPKFSIKAVTPLSAGTSTSLHLLPGQYICQPGLPTSFFIDSEGRIAAQKEGQYSEVLDLRDRQGTPLARVTAPNGDAEQTRRRQEEIAAQDLHDRVLAATERVASKVDFKLVEKMQLLDFSEQQVDYPIELPGSQAPDQLELLAFTAATVRAIPFQLSDDHTKISFRTDLPKGATRLFRLVPMAEVADTIPRLTSKPPTLQATSDPNIVLLDNGILSLQVPAGHQDFDGGKPLSQVAAPILGIARAGLSKPWTASESFAAPDAVRVNSLDAKLIESGPVFAVYQIDYQLSGGKSYSTRLKLRTGESHVSIAETASHFTPEDQAFLRLNYGEGMLNPDRRLITSHLPYSGNYDRNISTDDRYRGWYASLRWLDYNPALDDSKVPRLDIRLGLFIPNTLGVLYGATFYREDGEDALLLSIDQPEKWKEYTRYLWTDYRAVDNLRFYQLDGHKYMATALAGEKRFWVLGVIPRKNAVMRIVDKVPASPDVFLSQDLGLSNLNAEKNRMVDWPEKLDSPAPFDAVGTNNPRGLPARPMSFESFAKDYLNGETVRDILNFGAFYGQGYGGRSIASFCREYIVSRNNWTPEQRERARETLVFITDYGEGDWVQPHHGMMSGHPNFVMDTKQNVAVAAATFPNHPEARFWRDSFLGFYNEWLDRYERNDVPEFNTKGGRWTENIACYWGQSLSGILNATKALKQYDGTSLGQNPRVLGIIRWMRDAFMSPHRGARLIPPEGAHATAFEPGKYMRTNLFLLCAELAQDDPQLAREMLWIDSNGKEGTQPDVRSILYTDYGPVFHSDFGGAHESYAHMQNIYGMSYRWGYAGIVYYGAKNRVWSYNTTETNGDEFDWNQITAFNVNGKGMDPTPTDQLLYDFDFAQFYRIEAAKGKPYRARGLMLLRDDYLVLSDEVEDSTVAGRFNWVNTDDLPEIYQLKPGAPAVDQRTPDMREGRLQANRAEAKIRSYSGKGDFLTVVAPTAIQAAAAPFGAIVNGEYVFASQNPEEITQGTAIFMGNYGYARANQLALFQGTKIGLDGFVLSRDGGDFGVSAAVDKGQITGRIVGRSGGRIFVVPPAGINPASASVTIDGRPVTHTIEQGAIVFTVEIAQKDGLKNYRITF